MVRFIVRRFVHAVIVLVAVVFIVFSMMFLSGDPAMLLVAPDASAADVAALRAQMGFDRPFLVQFAHFAGRLLIGDFGQSWRFQDSALSIVLERLPATVELAVAALLVSLIIAITIGVLSAVRKDSKIDTISMVLALVGQSVPGFWLGLMLILVFAVKLGWLPTSGRHGFEYLILPSLSLGLALAGRNARLVRSCMLEVLSEDYIRTARAKGLSEWRVINKHALANALLPIITIVGLELGSLLGGAVITETVFSWPGIGLLAVQSITGRDYPVVQAVIIVSAVGFILINLVVDLLYSWLDPRISLSR